MQGELGTSHAYELGGDYRAVISVDLQYLNRVVEVDQTSRAALIEGGALGPELEAFKYVGHYVDAIDGQINGAEHRRFQALQVAVIPGRQLRCNHERLVQAGLRGGGRCTQ